MAGMESTNVFDFEQDQIVAQMTRNIPKIIEGLGPKAFMSTLISPTGTMKSTLIPYIMVAFNNVPTIVATSSDKSAASMCNLFNIIFNDRNLYINNGDGKKLAPKLQALYMGPSRETFANVQKYDNESGGKLVYTSHRIMKNILTKTFSKDGKVTSYSDFKLIILDDAHTSSTEIALTTGIYTIGRNAPNIIYPSMLIVSATLPEAYKRLRVGQVNVEVKIDSLPIKTIHVKTIIRKRHNAHKLEKHVYRRSIWDNMIGTAYKLHRDKPITSGHIVLFLPTDSDVKYVSSKLQELFSTPDSKRGNRKAVLISVDMNSNSKIMDLIYKDNWSIIGHKQEYGRRVPVFVDSNVRKIIITTTVMESGITIPHIGYVLDSMYELIQSSSYSDKLTYDIKLISKSSSIQRAGRTGRTIPGEYHCFITKEKYDKLPDSRTEAFNRIPITRVILEICNMGIQPKDIIKNVPEIKYDQAVNSIESMGLKLRGVLDLTDAGKFVVDLHVCSTASAAFIYHWIQSKMDGMYQCLIIAAILNTDLDGLFIWNRIEGKRTFSEICNIRESEVGAKKWKDIMGMSPLETCIKIWLKFEFNAKQEPDVFLSRMRTMCDNMSINFWVMKDIYKSFTKILKFMRQQVAVFDIDYEGIPLQDNRKRVNNCLLKVYSGSIYPVKYNSINAYFNRIDKSVYYYNRYSIPCNDFGKVSMAVISSRVITKKDNSANNEGGYNNQSRSYNIIFGIPLVEDSITDIDINLTFNRRDNREDVDVDIEIFQVLPLEASSNTDDEYELNNNIVITLDPTFFIWNTQNILPSVTVSGEVYSYTKSTTFYEEVARNASLVKVTDNIKELKSVLHIPKIEPISYTCLLYGEIQFYS